MNSDIITGFSYDDKWSIITLQLSKGPIKTKLPKGKSFNVNQLSEQFLFRNLPVITGSQRLILYKKQHMKKKLINGSRREMSPTTRITRHFLSSE